MAQRGSRTPSGYLPVYLKGTLDTASDVKFKAVKGGEKIWANATPTNDSGEAGGENEQVQFANNASLAGDERLLLNAAQKTLTASAGVATPSVIGLGSAVDPNDGVSRGNIDDLVSAASVSAAGEATELQINDNGAFGTDGRLAFDGVVLYSTGGTEARKLTGLQGQPQSDDSGCSKDYADAILDSLTGLVGGQPGQVITGNGAGGFVTSNALTFEDSRLAVNGVSTPVARVSSAPQDEGDAGTVAFAQDLAAAMTSAAPGASAGGSGQLQFRTSGGTWGASADLAWSGEDQQLAVGADGVETPRLEIRLQPTLASSAANKAYVDAVAAASGTSISGPSGGLVYNDSGEFVAAEGALFDPATNTLTCERIAAAKVTGLQAPANASDAATKGYVDSQVQNAVDTAPGVPAGSSGHVQFNDSGAFSSSADLVFDPGSRTLAAANTFVAGEVEITGVVDQSDASAIATRAYVASRVADASVGEATPGGSTGSIQRNSGSSGFTGSAGLTYAVGTGTLFANKIMSTGVVGLGSPQVGPDAANMQYVTQSILQATEEAPGIPGGETGSLQLASATGAFSGSPNFRWDGTNLNVTGGQVTTSKVSFAAGVLPASGNHVVMKDVLDSTISNLAPRAEGGAGYVQFNSSGAMAADANLRFVGGKLTATAIGSLANDATLAITGLETPEHPPPEQKLSSLATKAYVDSRVNSLTVGSGGEGALQISLDENTFTSFEGISYDEATGTLFAPSVTTPALAIADPPTLDTHVATRGYVLDQMAANRLGAPIDASGYLPFSDGNGGLAIDLDFRTNNIPKVQINAQSHRKYVVMNWAHTGPDYGARRDFVDNMAASIISGLHIPAAGGDNHVQVNSGSFGGLGGFTFDGVVVAISNLATKRISGLADLTVGSASSSVANKNYVDTMTSGISCVPAGSTTIVQWNNNGSFGRVPNLVWSFGADVSTSVLIVPNISCEKIDGLVESKGPDFAVNKAMVDAESSSTSTYSGMAQLQGNLDIFRVTNAAGANWGPMKHWTEGMSYELASTSPDWILSDALEGQLQYVGAESATFYVVGSVFSRNRENNDTEMQIGISVDGADPAEQSITHVFDTDAYATTTTLGFFHTFSPNQTAQLMLRNTSSAPTRSMFARHISISVTR